jgi:hypothetical protein
MHALTPLGRALLNGHHFRAAPIAAAVPQL